MDSLWVVAATATVAFLAVSLGIFAVERVGRPVLFAFLAGALGLDLLLAGLGTARAGLGNALVVATAVPVGAWIASLVRDWRGLIAVLVMAAIYDLVDSLADRAILSGSLSSSGSVLFLPTAVQVVVAGQVVSPLLLTDLIVLAVVLSCMARFEVPRWLSGATCLGGILASVVLENWLDASLARVPFLAICGLLGAAFAPDARS